MTVSRAVVGVAALLGVAFHGAAAQDNKLYELEEQLCAGKPLTQIDGYEPVGNPYCLDLVISKAIQKRINSLHEEYQGNVSLRLFDSSYRVKALYLGIEKVGTTPTVSATFNVAYKGKTSLNGVLLRGILTTEDGYEVTRSHAVLFEEIKSTPTIHNLDFRFNALPRVCYLENRCNFTLSIVGYMYDKLSTRKSATKDRAAYMTTSPRLCIASNEQARSSWLEAADRLLRYYPTSPSEYSRTQGYCFLATGVYNGRFYFNSDFTTEDDPYFCGTVGGSSIFKECGMAREFAIKKKQK